MNRDEQWYNNYALLKAFIEETGHLPNKKKVENRGLLNWWKYNKKLIKAGKLNAERMQLLDELSNMRTSIESSINMEPSASTEASDKLQPSDPKNRLSGKILGSFFSFIVFCIFAL